MKKNRSKKLSRSKISSKTRKPVVRAVRLSGFTKYLNGGHIGGKKISTKEKRWYKDVGLGYKTPTEAINGSYIGACIESMPILLS